MDRNGERDFQYGTPKTGHDRARVFCRFEFVIWSKYLKKIAKQLILVLGKAIGEMQCGICHSFQNSKDSLLLKLQKP